MVSNEPITRLKDALRRLPGIGPRSAQRIAFYMLERDQESARLLSDALLNAVGKVTHCGRCNNLSELKLCAICSSEKRNSELLCVVETPADLDIIEQAGAYNGLYLVLMGHSSPNSKKSSLS